MCRITASTKCSCRLCLVNFAILVFWNHFALLMTRLLLLFAALRNLKKLNLGGNAIATADQVAGEASGALPKALWKGNPICSDASQWSAVVARWPSSVDTE